MKFYGRVKNKNDFPIYIALPESGIPGGYQIELKPGETKLYGVTKQGFLNLLNLHGARLTHEIKINAAVALVEY